MQMPYSSTAQSNYTSELNTSSQTYSRDCRKSNYYYQIIRVNVLETGYYALSSSSNMDTFGDIYKDDFNPMNPVGNLLSQNYRACSYQDFKFIVYLHTVTTYILAVTTSSPNMIGNFSILTSGPSNITLDPYNKTVKKLREWSRVELYTYRRLAKLYPERTDRLAYCRNMLMDKAHLLLPDYIFIVDLDRFSTTVSSFLSNFQYDTNQWSVMTATSHDTYYDIWALRTLSDSVMNYDVWHRVSDLETPLNNYCHASVYDGIVGIHIKRIPIEHGLIEVRSAFNGAGLYKVNSTYKCKYDGRGFTCEHVPFHLCIREKNQARIFINPEFQVS
ncbi:unnamed protein product [Adineta steineri]|uniref:Uncharacterized protein n=1 Tax=Adineta steineri TaxID=433720 RepID=A0A813NC89_9BILA|nr:unnamed protein product [Adineta steineri]